MPRHDRHTPKMTKGERRRRRQAASKVQRVVVVARKPKINNREVAE